MKAYVCLFVVLGIASFGALGVAADFVQIRESNRVSDALSVQRQASDYRAEVRNQIVDEVIADQLTLAQAVERFGVWNEKTPETMTVVRLYFKGVSDKECLCRQVIHRVEMALQDHTAEAATVLPRLEREMHELLGETTSETK